MGKTEKLKRIIYLSAIALFIGVVLFVSRGPHISNALKKIILPELENMTGQKVIAQKIYLNIFPLFIEARGLKVFDDSGNRIMTADRVKGYLKLAGFLQKEAAIRRIVVVSPEIWADKARMDEITANIKKYLAHADPQKMKVSVDAIEVRDGNFSFYHPEQNALVTGNKINGEILLGDVPRLKADIKELRFHIKDFPELFCEVSTALSVKKDGIDIKSLRIKSYGSEMKAEGSYSSGGILALKTDIALIVDSVKKMLGLKKKDDGKIFAKGDIKFKDSIPFMDLEIKGNFYLQTLMEVLKVKEKVEGWVDFDGRLSGTFPKLTGSADARLKKGNFFGVAVDEARGKVSYSDNILGFTNVKGLLYNGRGDAEVSLKLPGIDYYSVKVNFADADSNSVFKLINLNINAPKGKVRGELYTAGGAFNPTGWFDYKSTEKGGDIFGRITSIKGSYKVDGDILSLNETLISTEKTAVEIKGAVSLPDSQLDIKAELRTSDVMDLTMPYFNRLQGTGYFAGSIKGKTNDPLVSGILNAASASVDDYKIENISGEISYKKGLLEIKELVAKSGEERHAIKGSIKFENARDIFDFKRPEYGLAVSLRNADFEKLAKMFYKKLPARGALDADFKIIGKGSNAEYSGSAKVSEAFAYNYRLDTVSADLSYQNKNLNIKRAELRKGASLLSLKGHIAGEKSFSFSAHADKIYLKDMEFKIMPDDAVMDISAEGSGTFDNPNINLSGNLYGGVFKGKSLGSGRINASVKNKDVLVTSAFFNEKVRVNARARLDDTLPWSAEIDVASGRYDFILAGLLKDVPEDLLVNIKGHAELHGDRKHFYSSSVVNQLNVALFGYSFSNDSEVRIKFDNRNMSFTSFTMRSGNSAFSVRGNMEIGREYNIVLEGNSSLAPLKGLSRRIGVLRGDADFTLSLTGKWSNPKIVGSLDVANAGFGLKDMHQRISSIHGYVYFEEDRIIIQRLSGKLGGGDIDVSGAVYLDGFNIKRFYIESKLDNITTAITKDFNMNFNGDLIYKGTLDSQSITGEAKITRASYRDRVEWKSWLLKTKTREKPKAEITRLEKAVLNVRITGSDNIIVDNNIARTPLKVDMLLRGTIGQPLLFGRVESKGGKVYFRNNEFRILSASADFADPGRINPVMEIVAQTIVKGYNIKLSLEGQMEHFNLSLISEPPLDETDILSLLTVGQVGRELKGLEGGIGASEAAAFLTGKVQDVFEDRLKNITGLDRVQVDPYVSKATGTIGPRVTVSKKLMGDRLYVTYVSTVGSTEEQVLKLEYILGRNVSLLGVRDEKGSLGGDIKFRFEFK